MTEKILLTIVLCICLGWCKTEIKDGSVIYGEIVNETDSIRVIENKYLGKIEVKKEYIEDKNEVVTSKKKGKLDPNDNSLIFMPTAFIHSGKRFYFKDFELLFLSFGGRVTDYNSLAVGFIFPVTSEFQALSFGFKQRIYMNDDRSLGISVSGNLTTPFGEFLEERDVLYNSLVIGSGVLEKTIGFHAAIGAGGYFGQENNNVEKEYHVNPNYFVGFDAKLSKHSKFIVEVFDDFSFFGDEDEDSYHFLNIGFRFYGQNIGVDLSGLRPIGPDDFIDIIFLPFVNVVFRF